MKLSARLTELRENKGWSKTYVAKMLHLNLGTYANYEYGTREPDLGTLNNIAKLFGVSIDYLIGNSDLTDKKRVDIDDEGVIMTFEGKEIPPEDIEIIKRVLRGGRSE